MRRAERSIGLVVLLAGLLVLASSATGRAQQSEEEREGPPAEAVEEPSDKREDDYDQPALPEGKSLEEVLERAAEPPPEDFPDPVPDDNVHAFLLVEQLEYRFDGTGRPDQLGMELDGWLGGDFNKLWWKNESDGAFRRPRRLEAETDLLYARLITSFWYAQIGAQYANDWTADGYEDRWSGVVALQGLAPGMFELDVSAYVSESADVTFELEGEYDIRFTQRLVLQPLVEMGFATQDIPERNIGAGMTDAIVDLRLRYEIKREFAPYIGGRWHVMIGETGDRVEADGGDASRLFLVGGIRFGIY